MNQVREKIKEFKEFLSEKGFKDVGRRKGKYFAHSESNTLIDTCATCGQGYINVYSCHSNRDIWERSIDFCFFKNNPHINLIERFVGRGSLPTKKNYITQAKGIVTHFEDIKNIVAHRLVTRLIGAKTEATGNLGQVWIKTKGGLWRREGLPNGKTLTDEQINHDRSLGYLVPVAIPYYKK